MKEKGEKKLCEGITLFQIQNGKKKKHQNFLDILIFKKPIFLLTNCNIILVLYINYFSNYYPVISLIFSNVARFCFLNAQISPKI